MDFRRSQTSLRAGECVVGSNFSDNFIRKSSKRPRKTWVPSLLTQDRGKALITWKNIWQKLLVVTFMFDGNMHIATDLWQSGSLVQNNVMQPTWETAGIFYVICSYKIFSEIYLYCNKYQCNFSAWFPENKIFTSAAFEWGMLWGICMSHY